MIMNVFEELPELPDVSESLCQQHVKMFLVHPVQIHSPPTKSITVAPPKKTLNYHPFPKGDSFPKEIRVQAVGFHRNPKPSSSFTSSTTVISSYIWRDNNFKNS